MRDIKFRAWNGKSRMMQIVCRLVGKEYLQITTGLSLKNNLMQFTGLLDKNGKEIWEGDIVKVPYNHFGNVVVKWDSSGRWNISTYDISRLKIIGNIHESPELLEELV